MTRGRSSRCSRNPAVASAAAPLDIDLPYASHDNDISVEARHTHGKRITGVAIGAQEFSLCFPGDMELEGNVWQDGDGRLVLRVFYEQW